MSFLKKKASSDFDDYLDHIFDVIDPNIKLDDDQKRAVVADDKYSLVIAGAGTGKTTTVAAKVKYLVDIAHVDPHKILVMSYTKKATEELERRIVVDLDIPADVKTFHSLGLRYYRLLNPGKKIVPIDNNYKNKIFVGFLKGKVFPFSNKLNEMVELFNDDEIHWESPEKHTYGSYFKEHFSEYDDFDKYFNDYIDHKIKETENIRKKVIDIVDSMVNSPVPRTIRNEAVKSKGEAVIANYLFCNGVEYSYEKIYEELMNESGIYKPDFTIDVGGEKIYIEYFGLSGNDLDNKSYDKIRKKKEEYHKIHHNKFISLDYKPNRGYLADLADKLKKYDVILKPKDIEEIYYEILSHNPLAEFFGLKNFIYETIECIKNSEKVHTKEDVRLICREQIRKTNQKQRQDVMLRQCKWILDFWRYYRDCNDSNNIEYIDFSDMINGAIGQLNKIDKNLLNYDYIIVDEYQDVSAKRYELLNETVDRCKAKLMAVGDDWQSIYSFMGGKIKYIYDFNFFFPNAGVYYIKKTYRNSQTLVNIAGSFIMKNHDQVEKRLVANKNYLNPIEIIKRPLSDSGRELKKFVKGIHYKYPNDSILVLAHTNYAIRKLLMDPDFMDAADNKVKIRGINDFYFDLMTIHKSKGLTYDWVILMPLPKNFPHDPFNKFWMTDIFRNLAEHESIEYPEFRRLFYVALTRTRKKVIVLASDKGYERSRYIDEIEGIIDSER